MLVLFLMVIAYANSLGQSPATKDITYHTQSWYSFNSTWRFGPRWGAVGDFHVRREDFVNTDYFYFLRFGGVYWIEEKYPVIVGYAHLWLAPPPGNVTWSNENRIYQQWSGAMNQGKATILSRIRLEERWKDEIVNDAITGDKDFSVRLRYLFSFEKRFVPDRTKVSVVVSDEVLVQFGKSVVLNTFDQNRLFLGIKVPMSERLSCDLGYMNILQQKSGGYQYDISHVFRLFFYYNVDFTRSKFDFGHQDATD